MTRRKVVLVNPSYRNSYSNSFGSVVNPVFPVLSLASLAAIAENEGYECEILDFCFEDYSAEKFIKKILEKNPDIVGFSVLPPCIIVTKNQL
tara:strand:+ start:104 stop:379 length:276 start_codon:yes stop_codon:yes gene_type:complete